MVYLDHQLVLITQKHGKDAEYFLSGISIQGQEFTQMAQLILGAQKLI